MKKYEFDVHDLKKVFQHFICTREPITFYVGELEMSGNFSSFDLLSKLFADYAIDEHENYFASTKSPLEFISEVAELFHRARTRSVFPSRTISSDKETLAFAEKLNGDILYGEVTTIREYIADSVKAVVASEAIEGHYERRRIEANDVISAPKLRTLIMERDGAKCRWCGETDGLALDHVIPVVAGGTDDPENLQLLCKSCNSSKGDRVPSSAKLIR